METLEMPLAEASVMNPALKEWDVPIGHPVALHAFLTAVLCFERLNLNVNPDLVFRS